MTMAGVFSIVLTLCFWLDKYSLTSAQKLLRTLTYPNQDVTIIYENMPADTFTSPSGVKEFCSLYYISFPPKYLESSNRNRSQLYSLLMDKSESESTDSTHLQFITDSFSTLFSLLISILKFKGINNIKQTPLVTRKKKMFIQINQPENAKDFQHKLLETIQGEFFTVTVNGPRNCTIRLDDHIYIIHSDKENITVYELYCVGETLVFQQVELSLSSEHDKNVVSLSNDIELIEKYGEAIRRSDFKGTELQVVGQKDSDYMDLIYSEVVNGTLKFLSGACVKILEDFQLMMNFSYKAIEGLGWGVVLNEDDIETTAIISQVSKTGANIDLCISLLVVNTDRQNIIDFLPTLSYSTTYAFFLEPDVTSVNNIFLMPFNRDIWILLLVIYMLVILLCTIFSFFSRKHLTTTNNSATEKQSKMDSLHDLTGPFITVIGICCQQHFTPGSGKMDMGERTNCLIRLIMVIITLMSFLLLIFYQGSFIMSVSVPSIPIKTSKDFKTHNYKLFTDPRAPFFANDFATDEGHEMEILELSQKLYDRHGETAVTEIFSRNSKLAFLFEVDGFIAYSLNSGMSLQDVCKINRIHQESNRGLHNAMFVKQGSMYSEQFRYRTVMLIERGANHRYMKAYDRKTIVQCLDEYSLNIKTLEAEECSPAFIILSCGAFLALCFLLVEVVHVRIHKLK